MKVYDAKKMSMDGFREFYFNNGVEPASNDTKTLRFKALQIWEPFLLMDLYGNPHGGNKEDWIVVGPDEVRIIPYHLFGGQYKTVFPSKIIPNDKLIYKLSRLEAMRKKIIFLNALSKDIDKIEVHWNYIFIPVDRNWDGHPDGFFVVGGDGEFGIVWETPSVTPTQGHMVISDSVLTLVDSAILRVALVLEKPESKKTLSF